MPWRKSPVIFPECIQIWSFCADFCQSTYWKFVQASRFGLYGRTDGRTTDRGDAATNCCSPVNRNCTTLCSHLVCCCNTTDSCTAPDVQLCAVPAGVVGNVACWRSYVHVNAVCKLIFNRDSVDRRWGNLNALGLMQILFPFSPICTSDFYFVRLKWPQVLKHEHCMTYGSVKSSLRGGCLWVCTPFSNCIFRRFGRTRCSVFRVIIWCILMLQ